MLSLFNPWQYNDTRYGTQQAGFLTTFTGGLSFATVHHAGHEVPAYQPERALQLFRNFLDGSFFFNMSNAMEGGSVVVETSAPPPPAGWAVAIAVFAVVGAFILLALAYFTYKFYAKKAFQYKLTEDLDDSKHSPAVEEI